MKRSENALRMVRNYGVVLAVLSLCLAQASSLSAPSFPLSLFPSSLNDSLRFGDPASEQAHGMMSTLSDTITGGLNEPARRLLPQNPPTFEGGTLTFTLKVDPVEPNYVTIRLWGSDISQDRLVLFCEGKQIGYHHLGDVDLLDFGDDSEAPAYNGRFFYNTTPIPVEMTQGKTLLHCQIRCLGRIWGYGTTFEQYQKNMTEPTRGIYGLYSHTDGYFVPPAEEKQGEASANPPTRRQPGPEVLDQLKARVDREINGLSRRPRLDQMQMQFLAKAYHIPWTSAYHSQQVVDQVAKGLDQLFVAYRNNPKLVELDPATPNPDWFGFGPAGDALRMLAKPLQPVFDLPLMDEKGALLPRRAAWSEMFQAGRDWHRRHRRQYTNQSMIIDMCIYASNRGVEILDPAHALPEEQAKRYLYEAVGLVPWLGSDTENGPEKPLGDHYYQLTTGGLTRELGFAGYYGEVLDWVAQIYDVTCDPGQTGDPKIKAQLARITHARALFRYPMLDAGGNRAMRAETIVGWRDAHYPGDITYSERPSWDGTPVYAATLTQDPEAIGSVQQMFADNQFFASLQESLKTGGLRTTEGLMGAPEQYERLKTLPVSALRLPMSPGQPDFAWADVEDGVVAVKHGSDILYASLYWRARYAINNLARIHYITPRYDRIAVVRQEEKFEPSGMYYTVPDWIDQGFAWNSHAYPGNLHQAQAGEKLPIPKMPEGVKFKLGEENSYAGKADFYACHYGDYLIGMNCTAEKQFALNVPPGISKAIDLISGKAVSIKNGSVSVAPKSTLVLYLGSENFRK